MKPSYAELLGLLCELSARVDELEYSANGREDLRACNRDVKEVIAKIKGGQ